MGLFDRLMKKKNTTENEAAGTCAEKCTDTVKPVQTEHPAEKAEFVPDKRFEPEKTAPCRLLWNEYPEGRKGTSFEPFRLMNEKMRLTRGILEENFFRVNDSSRRFPDTDKNQLDLIRFLSEINSVSKEILDEIRQEKNELKHAQMSGRNPDEVQAGFMPSDFRIITGLAENEVRAWIYIFPPRNGGKDVTAEDISAALAENGIVYGIDSEAVSGAAFDRLYFTVVEAAKGDDPVNGEKGYVKELFSRETNRVNISEDENGRVNYKELGTIQNIHAGDHIAEIIPPGKGANGKSVTGAEVKAEDGRPARFKFGSGTVKSEDGKFISAKTDGELSFRDGAFCVNKVMRINHDIDVSTGNIDFAGDIIIYGNIREGFSVKCEGSMHLEGHSEAADICVGGDLVITKGMFGGSAGKIEAGGNLTCKYLENCRVSVKGDVQADQILNCTVHADGKVEASGEKGRIIGGSISGACGIKADYIGTVHGNTTAATLEVGMAETVKRLTQEHEEKLRACDESIEKLQKNVAALSKMRDRMNQVQMAMFEKIKLQLETETEERERLQEKFQKTPRTCEIRCRVLRSSVNIIYDGVKYSLDQNLDDFHVYKSENRIVVKGKGFEKSLRA